MPKTHTSFFNTDAHLTAPFDAVEAALRDMVEDTIGRCVDNAADPDMTFGSYSALFSLAKAAQTLEGNLIRDAVAALLQSTGLTAITEVELPITDGAMEAVKANDPALLTGIRLDPEVYAESSYRADMVIADEAKRQAYLVEVKRATVNYAPGKLRDYRQRLTAAAFMVPTLLWRDHRIGVRNVEVVILDAADNDRRPGTCAMRLSGFEALLGLPGFTDAMTWLRQTYAAAFQTEARRQITLAAGDACDNARTEEDVAALVVDTDEHGEDAMFSERDGFPDWPITISLGAQGRAE